MTRFPKDPDDVRMSLGEHLEELRRRIILALLGFGAALALCFAFGTPILRVLIKPVDDAVRKINVEIIARRQMGRNPQGTTPASVNVTAPEPSLVIITPIEGFTAYLKAAMVGAIAISSPWVLYQFWLFVAAGLYPHERRIIHIFVPFSAVLFMAGAVFSYMVVVRYGLHVLLTFGGLVGEMIRPEIRVTAAIDFVLILSLMMGAVFQLPLVMLALSKVGLVQPSTYVKQWRYAVAGIVIIAGVLTPPDAFTQIAMAIPMLVLYWLGVLLTKVLVKKG